MRKNINVLIVVFLFLNISCKTKDLTIYSNPDIINVLIAQKGDVFEFTVKNKSSEIIYFMSSKSLDIEKLVNGKWVQLRILPCPCDAPCRNSEQEIILKNKGSYSFFWNMKESWCGDKKISRMVRETITQKIDKGKYRINLKVKQSNGIIQIIKEEFVY